MHTMTNLLRSTCLAFGVMLTALPVAAQTSEPAKTVVPSEPASTTATYGSWVLRCVQPPAPAASQDSAKSARPVGQTCEVVQTVQVQGQPQPIAQVAVGRVPNEKDLFLTALVPANVSLPGSVHVSGNGKTGAEEKGGLALGWQKCFGGVCAANGKLDAATSATLRAGTEGQLRFADANGNIVGIPLSWKGFDQAMAALEKIK